MKFIGKSDKIMIERLKKSTWVEEGPQQSYFGWSF